MYQIVAVITAYLAIVLALGLRANRMRPEAAELARLIQKDGLSSNEQRAIQRVLNSGDSWRTAVIGVLAFAQGLVMPSSAVKREMIDFADRHPNLAFDARFYELTRISRRRAYAINPLFALVAIALSFAYRVKLHFTFHSREEKRVVDMRILSAA